MGLINYVQILFWKLAIHLIKKGYGANCVDYDGYCESCKARKVIEWIEEHIELLKL